MPRPGLLYSTYVLNQQFALTIGTRSLLDGQLLTSLVRSPPFGFGAPGGSNTEEKAARVIGFMNFPFITLPQLPFFKAALCSFLRWCGVEWGWVVAAHNEKVRLEKREAEKAEDSEYWA